MWLASHILLLWNAPKIHILKFLWVTLTLLGAHNHMFFWNALSSLQICSPSLIFCNGVGYALNTRVGDKVLGVVDFWKVLFNGRALNLGLTMLVSLIFPPGRHQIIAGRLHTLNRVKQIYCLTSGRVHAHFLLCCFWTLSKVCWSVELTAIRLDFQFMDCHKEQWTSYEVELISHPSFGVPVNHSLVVRQIWQTVL